MTAAAAAAAGVDSSIFLPMRANSGVLLLLLSMGCFCIVTRLSAAVSVSAALGASSCFLIAKLALVDSCVERRVLLLCAIVRARSVSGDVSVCVAELPALRSETEAGRRGAVASSDLNAN